MRLRLLTFLAAIVVAVSALRAQTPTPREAAGVVGPVRTVEAVTVWARRVDGRLLEDGRRVRRGTVTFHPDGRYAEQELFDDFDGPIGRETFRYEGQRLIEEMHTDPNGALLERRTYAYGTTDAPESMVVTRADGMNYVERYRRGRQGRIEETAYVVDGRVVSRTEFKYDGTGLLVKMTFRMADGKPATAYVGPCLGAHRVEYRYRGNRISERVLYEADGSLKERTVVTYDAGGNVREERRSTVYGKSQSSYEYQLDGRGNWTTRIMTAQDEDLLSDVHLDPRIVVTRRVITYY